MDTLIFSFCKVSSMLIRNSRIVRKKKNLVLLDMAFPISKIYKSFYMENWKRESLPLGLR